MRWCLSLSFLVFSFPLTVFGQNAPIVKWWKQIGGARNDDAKMAIENFQGGITAIGNTKSKAYRKGDIFMLFLDANSNELAKLNHGGTGEDGANAIVQTYDGGYVIAGFTESLWPESKGKRDAWLVKTNESGIILWDIILGAEDDDEFFDLTQATDGGLVAVGKSGNRAYLVKVNTSGVLLWEKNLDINSSSGRSLVLTENDEIVLCGTSGEPDRQFPFLMKLRPDGDSILWEKNYSDWEKTLTKKIPYKFKYIHPEDLIITRDGGLAMTGTAGVYRKMDDMFFLRTDKDGEFGDFEIYGGSREDGGKSIVQSFDGNFLLAGYNSSASGRGERRSSAWANYIQPNGKEIWEAKKAVFGGSQNDEASSVVQMNNGSLLLAGFTGNLIERDAYFIHLENLPIPEQTGKPDIAVQQINFHDENANGILEPKERGYISFTITNRGSDESYSLSVDVDTLSFTEGVLIYPKIVVGHLPAQSSRKVTIPVEAVEDVKTGISVFEARILDALGAVITSFSFDLQSQKKAVPQLEIASFQFLKTANPKRDDIITLEVELVNRGDAKAEDVFFKFVLPNDVQPMGENAFKVDALPPDSTAIMVLSFKVNSLYSADTILIETLAGEKRQAYDLVNSFSTILPPDPIVYFSKNQVQDNPILVRWSVPDPLEKGYVITLTNRAEFEVKFQLQTQLPLSVNDFQLFINDSLNLSQIKNSEAYPGALAGTYFFKATLLLSDYSFDVHLEISYEGRKIRSEKIRLQRELKKASLHVYAFGVPQKDLKATATDAINFATQFQEQGGENKIYEKVYIHQYVTAEKTTTQSLWDAMVSIRDAWDVEKKIKEDDTIILFLSSHGILSQRGNKLRISGSDYDVRYSDARSIDFQSQIIDYLADIPAKKLIFLDACHSGSAWSNLDEKGGLAAKSITPIETKDITKAITDLANNSPGYIIMASCKKDQQSYEDKDRKYGIFTRALVEAFSNKEVEGVRDRIRGDNDNNRIIYLDELYYFAVERIPILLKQNDANPEATQEPYLSEEHLKLKFPLFVVDK